MKAIYFDKKPQLKVDYPKPVPNDNEVLIKVILAGICATDKEIIKGYQNYKGVMGHEFVGVVEEYDDPNLIGKRVVGAINIGCGECEFCLLGMPNHCNNRRAIGIHGKDGCFAEYLTLPEENIYILPNNIPEKEAVFCEPLAAAMHAFDDIELSRNHKVAVMGDGKLGLLVVKALSTTVCNIILFGKHQERSQLVNNYCTFENHDKAKDYNNYFDVVIDCSGVQGTLYTASNIIKPKGSILLKSTYAEDVLLDPSLWVRKEIKLIGSRCGNIQAAVDFLGEEEINLANLIDAEYDIEDWQEAFEKAFKKGSLKVLLRF